MKIRYLIFASVIILILFFAGKFIYKSGQDSVKVECQTVIVQQQEKIIEENKNVQIRKQINKNIPADDVVERLFKIRCPDCSNKK